MNSLLSVVITSYNKKKYLKRCLESLSAQNLSNVEVIIMDDNSTDGSYEVAKQYKNMTLIKNKTNLGICENRNKGVSLSKGKYITFLDCDDYVSDDYIDVLMDIINNQTADIYIFGVNKYKFGEMHRHLTFNEGLYSFKEFVNNNTKIFLNAYGSYWIWNKVFKRKIIIDNNIKFDKYFAEDEDFCIKYYKYVNKIYIIDKYLYNYDYNETSMSNSETIKQSDVFKIIVTNNYNLFKDNNISLDLLNDDIELLYKCSLKKSNSLDEKRIIEDYYIHIINKIKIG